MREPVVELENATVERGSDVVLSRLNWMLREGESWAVVGPTGAGKTTLAETILGRHHVHDGTVRWPLLERLRSGGKRVDYPSQVIAHVTFKEESRLFSYAGHYYQQRFEFADTDEPLSLDQFLRSGTIASDGAIVAIAERLGVRDQLAQPFMTLSNGQTRRARLARALLKRPELLILDDPFIGLDTYGRTELSILLGELVKEGQRLVLICRADMVPGWMTNTLELTGRARGVSPSPHEGEVVEGSSLRPNPPAPFPKREGGAIRLERGTPRAWNVVRRQHVDEAKLRRAKELRRGMTPAERVLWKHLRKNQLGGFHFRRQQVIAGFLADFYCDLVGLVIEVDGEIHEAQKDYDAERDVIFRQLGILVLRIPNDVVLQQTPAALTRIESECRRLALPEPNPPSPISRREEEEGGENSSPPSLLGKGVGGLGRSDNPTSISPAVVELHNVSVKHSGRAILDRITWTVRAGERWAVVGPNGSGKSTLLSLLCGDHPQAYSNDIRLFGRRRGTGETIWDVKRNVGLVSPEFHLYFTEPLTAERAVETGFFDGVTNFPTSAEQNSRVRELFEAFDIEHLADRPFKNLSTGEQRLVLLARALVKRPPLVILDEPFQALDIERVELCRDWLDRELGVDQTLLFVTHEVTELPRMVTRTLHLQRGKVDQVLERS